MNNEHPRNFREKLHTKTDLLLVEPTVSRFVVKTVFMPSTSLEMHQNRFRPGLRPRPHWGSSQRSLRPLVGGEGARRVLPKNPTPSSALRASAIRAICCVVPQHPPKINPSYGLCSWLPPFCEQNLLRFIQPKWQLRRTYFFNHYNVLF